MVLIVFVELTNNANNKAITLNGNPESEDFYLNKCQDVRKDIYERVSHYDPEGDISFEKVYSECIEMIKFDAVKN